MKVVITVITFFIFKLCFAGQSASIGTATHSPTLQPIVNVITGSSEAAGTESPTKAPLLSPTQTPSTLPTETPSSAPTPTPDVVTEFFTMTGECVVPVSNCVTSKHFGGSGIMWGSSESQKSQSTCNIYMRQNAFLTVTGSRYMSPFMFPDKIWINSVRVWPWLLGKQKLNEGDLFTWKGDFENRLSEWSVCFSDYTTTTTSEPWDTYSNPGYQNTPSYSNPGYQGSSSSGSNGIRIRGRRGKSKTGYIVIPFPLLLLCCCCYCCYRKGQADQEEAMHVESKAEEKEDSGHRAIQIQQPKDQFRGSISKGNCKTATEFSAPPSYDAAFQDGQNTNVVATEFSAPPSYDAAFQDGQNTNVV